MTQQPTPNYTINALMRISATVNTLQKDIAELITAQAENLDRQNITAHNDSPCTLTVKEAAKILNLSEPIVRQLIAERNLPAFHVGKRVLISGRGLYDWVDRQCAEESDRRRDYGKAC